MITNEYFETGKPSSATSIREPTLKALPSSGSSIVVCLSHISLRWPSFGYYQYRVLSSLPRFEGRSETQEISNKKYKVLIERRILPAAWLGIPGVTLQIQRIWRDWQCSFHFTRIVGYDSPVFDACIFGDIEKVIRLIDEGLATIFDIFEDGSTLLHVSRSKSVKQFVRIIWKY